MTNRFLNQLSAFIFALAVFFAPSVEAQGVVTLTCSNGGGLITVRTVVGGIYNTLQCPIPFAAGSSLFNQFVTVFSVGNFVSSGFNNVTIGPAFTSVVGSAVNIFNNFTGGVPPGTVVAGGANVGPVTGNAHNTGASNPSVCPNGQIQVQLFGVFTLPGGGTFRDANNAQVDGISWTVAAPTNCVTE